MSQTLPPTPPESAVYNKEAGMSREKMIAIGVGVYGLSAAIACIMYFADGDANDLRLDGLGRIWNFGKEIH